MRLGDIRLNSEYSFARLRGRDRLVEGSKLQMAQFEQRRRRTWVVIWQVVQVSCAANMLVLFACGFRRIQPGNRFILLPLDPFSGQTFQLWPLFGLTRRIARRLEGRYTIPAIGKIRDGHTTCDSCDNQKSDGVTTIAHDGKMGG